MSQSHEPFPCRKCGGSNRVIDTRANRLGNVRRRRECIPCGHRWSTYEYDDQREVDQDAADMITRLRSLLDELEERLRRKGVE